VSKVSDGFDFNNCSDDIIKTAGGSFICKALSVDHKPDLAVENDRIIKVTAVKIICVKGNLCTIS
jgi:hypothetical protein